MHEAAVAGRADVLASNLAALGLTDDMVEDAARGGGSTKLPADLRLDELVGALAGAGIPPKEEAAKLAIVQLLVAAGADVNARNGSGWTPLHFAIGPRKGISQALLAAGETANAKEPEGHTPLHFAALFGGFEVVESLLAHGSDANAKNRLGATPMFFAVARNDPIVVDLLLAGDADVSARNNQRWTPLHAAASRGHRQVAELLLTNKAVVDTKDDQGWTPLNRAASEGNHGVVELLLAHNAELAQVWLSELDPDGEIARLPAVVREELIGGSAAWPDDYIVVRGWSEGTGMLQEAMQETPDEDQAKAAFFARLDSRREGWALRMLRSAHVLKGAGNVDWRTFAGTAMDLLDGRALETIPIMEYVCERTYRALAIQELRGGLQ